MKLKNEFGSLLGQMRSRKPHTELCQNLRKKKRICFVFSRKWLQRFFLNFPHFRFFSIPTIWHNKLPLVSVTLKRSYSNVLSLFKHNMKHIARVHQSEFATMKV